MRSFPPPSPSRLGVTSFAWLWPCRAGPNKDMSASYTATGYNQETCKTMIAKNRLKLKNKKLDCFTQKNNFVLCYSNYDKKT